MINIAKLKADCYDLIAVIRAVHSDMGPGLNEYVYQEAMQIELAEWSDDVQREVEFHPTYRGKTLEATYRLDFLCEKRIIIECKAVSKLTPDHRAQLFNYMRLTGCPIGILVNFAPKYYELERYFYDADEQMIYTADGDEVVQFAKRKSK